MTATELEGAAAQAELLALAEAYLPGAALGAFYLPPELAFVIARGQGSRVWDLAGREYVDYVMGSGPTILGHAHPALVAAVQAQVARGSTFFYLTEPAIRLAERIVQAVPCAESVKFTSSGSEATLHALRMARAFTGRNRVLKFEGGYHGVQDYGLHSAFPARAVDYPAALPDSAGIPRQVTDDVLVAPFNDLATTGEIIEAHAGELAAVLVEPVQRAIPPQPGFLAGLRAVTQRHGIVLIFDEVVTGFRLAWGGAQEHFQVLPDLATLGKGVTGGLPLGAIAGRQDIMAVTDPRRRGQPDFVYFGGTLGGNPLSAAVGMATLGELAKPGVYDRLHAVGTRLRAGMAASAARHGHDVQVVGTGPLLQVFFTDRPIVGHRDTMTADRTRAYRLGVGLLQRGIFNTPGGKLYASLAHTDQDIEQTLDAFDGAFRALGSE